MIYEKIDDLREFAAGFDRLKAITFRDIVVNEWRLRVMGAHFMDIGPDWDVKKHRHSFFEFHYVLQGSVVTNLNGKDLDIKAGQFYLMPPGTVHSHRQNTGTSHKGFALRWELTKTALDQAVQNNIFPDLELIEPLLFKFPDEPFCDHDGSVLESIRRLLKKTEQSRFAADLQITFLELIILLAGSYSHDLPAVPVQREKNCFIENRIVDCAIAFIEDNYMRPINAADAANSVHLSYSHLARLFRKYSGETIVHHINNMRLQKAQRLLLCTDLPVARIAEESGFRSKNYFCTIFKKFFNISPVDYRKQISRLSE